MARVDRELLVKISTDLDDLKGGLRQSDQQVGGFIKNLKRIGQVGAVIAVADQFRQVAGAVVNTRAKFETLEKVLGNTLGSNSVAQEALREIQKFAVQTPFQVEELSRSFVKLANRGFVPTIDQLAKLGDIAAFSGKSIDQLVEALLDAETFEFERLKEFGIIARNIQGDASKITATFRGQTKEVEKTAEGIREYLLGLSELEGVQGAVSSQTDTLATKTSNLSGAFDLLLNSIGKATEAQSKGFLDFFTDIVSGIDLFIKEQTGQLTDVEQATLDLARAREQLAISEGQLKGRDLEDAGFLLREDIQERRAAVDAAEEQLKTEKELKELRKVQFAFEQKVTEERKKQQEEEEEAAEQARKDFEAFKTLRGDSGSNQLITSQEGSLEGVERPDLTEGIRGDFAKLSNQIKATGKDADQFFANLRANQGDAAQFIAGSVANTVTALATGTLTIKDFFKQLLKQLLRTAIQAAITLAILSAIGAPVSLGGALKGASGLVNAASFLGNTSGLATGGVTKKSGVFQVGERGKENIFLPAGTKVQNSVGTARASTGGTGVNVNVSGEFILQGTTLKAAIRKADQREKRRG